MAKPHTSILNSQPINELVNLFDFKKMNVKDSTSDNYLHVGLAPSYGTLKDDTSMKNMDQQLLIMIASTWDDLINLPPNKRTWEGITSLFMQNNMLEPDGDGICRSGCYTKQSTSRFKFDGSPDPSVVQEVMTWFTELINNADVLESTAIDIKVMAEIVAQSGAAIVNFATLVYKKEYHSKDIVDIGVLRFPDPNHPRYKVYRIRLFAWSQSRRVFHKQEDSNGITCEFWSRSFKPRQYVIDRLDAEMKDRVSAECIEKLSAFIHKA